MGVGGKAAQLPVDQRGGGAAGGIEQHPIVPGVGHVEIAAGVQEDSRRVCAKYLVLSLSRGPFSALKLSMFEVAACENPIVRAATSCRIWPTELPPLFGRSRDAVRGLACVSGLYHPIVRGGPREDPFLFLPSFSFGYCEP